MPPVPPGPIKIAILDDYQNIAVSYFESLGSKFEITTFSNTLLPFNHPSTPTSVRKELINRLKPYTIISSMRERTPFPAPLLQQLPNLKLLLTTGNRNAAIDLEACRKLNVHVTGTTGAAQGKKKRGPDSTTVHTVALILGLARNISDDCVSLRAGAWQSEMAMGLSGKTFATLGLGRLGGNVAKIMYESFGMSILCWSISLTQEEADERAKALGLPVVDEDGEKVFKVVSKEELFQEADVLSVHYVLSDRSRGIVGAKDLALMKPSSILINTSRGPLVDDGALLATLEGGKIRGAALDVFDLEPLPADSKWRSNSWGKDGKSRVLVTPHMGYVEEEIMNSWYAEQVETVERWLEGKALLNVLT